MAFILLCLTYSLTLKSIHGSTFQEHNLAVLFKSPEKEMQFLLQNYLSRKFSEGNNCRQNFISHVKWKCIKNIKNNLNIQQGKV